ncbi:hypothetical protein RBU61_03870 [Tissierella sp. MB52-C2]|uniref:hypothetical protein n=1 Tax=Tissierella sp. MB52-C2 TaxID=3070999 RepID=UPI00280C0C12|nr:hypothetical protein [Tissierella sp. MB52-C2]WMM25816.1 hypothetical protein RBU61_03870 [Tissierella sp. MB52-C2]
MYKKNKINSKIIIFTILLSIILNTFSTLTLYAEKNEWSLFKFTTINAKEYNKIFNEKLEAVNINSNFINSMAIGLEIQGQGGKYVGIPSDKDINSYELTLTKAEVPSYYSNPGSLVLDGKKRDYFLPVSHQYTWTYDNGNKSDTMPIWFILKIDRGDDQSKWTDVKDIEDLWAPFANAYDDLMILAEEIEKQGLPKNVNDYHPNHAGYLKAAANDWSKILQRNYFDPRLDFDEKGNPYPKKFDRNLRREQIEAAIENMYTHIDYVKSHRVNEPEILEFEVDGYHGIVDKKNSKVTLYVEQGASLNLDNVKVTTPDWVIARHKSGELKSGKTAIYSIQSIDALYERYGAKPYDNIKRDWEIQVVEGNPQILINSVRYTSPEGQKVEGIIEDNKITLNIPFGVDLESLPLEIYYSGDEICYIDKNENETIFKNKDILDARNPITLRVKQNGITKEYILNINTSKSRGNKILSFKIGEYLGNINHEEGIVEVKVPYGTDLTKLKPLIEIDFRSVISPRYNELQDFSKEVEYKVTSEYGENKIYRVNVIYENPVEGNEILSFRVGSIEGTINGEDITLSVPSNMDLKNIKPSIEISPYAKVAPASGETVNFSKGKVTYTVTAQNSSTKLYYVEIKADGEEKPGPDKEYLDKLKTIRDNIKDRYKSSASDDWEWMNLGFYEGIENGFEDGIRKNAEDLPHRFDLYKEIRDLKTIKLTDMARGVMMLTAMGIDASNLSQFSIDGEPFKTGDNVETADLTDNIYNYSRDTGTVNDFIFGLIALDMGNYSVPDNARYTREKMLDIILAHRYGTDDFGIDMVAMLMQSLYPYRYDPIYGERVKDKLDEGLDIILGHKTAPGVEPMRDDYMFEAWGSINSESADQVIIALCSVGIDPFSDTRFSRQPKDNLIYNVIDKFVTRNMDGFGHDSNSYNSMATYQGMYMLQWYINFIEEGSNHYSLYYEGVPFDFSKNFSSEAEITYFELLGKVGDIDHENGIIKIEVPKETTEEELSTVPIIKVSENAFISPSIDTVQDFTKEISYTVIAEAGSTEKIYRIIIEKKEDVLSGEKEITSVGIKEMPKAKININKQNREVIVVLPSDTEESKLKNLILSIEYRGESISPDPSEPQNYTHDVKYTIRAKDGSTADYIVKVFIEEADKYEFTKFVLRGVEGKIDTIFNEIKIDIPFGAFVGEEGEQGGKVILNEAEYGPWESTTSIVPAPTNPIVFEDENEYKILPYPSDNMVKYNVKINYVEVGGSSEISQFSIGRYTGKIEKNSIILTIPDGKTERQFKEELRSKIPNINWNGKSIDPMPDGENNSLKYKDKNGEYQDDYLKDYVLSDNEGNVNIYTVKFIGGSTNPGSEDSDKDDMEIISFTVNGIDAIIDNEHGRIFLEVPFEMENYNVFPIIISSKGVSIYPDLSQSIDLRKNNVYTLQKGDNYKQYTLIVRRAQPKPATLLWRYMEESLDIPYYQRVD